MSLYARLAGLVLILVLLIGVWHWGGQRLARADRAGYARAQSEADAAAQAQAARNRELQRGAELRYTVTAAERERVITRTLVEVRDATAALADCRLSDDAVRLLNDAARSAGQDRPAAGGAGDGLRPPG